MIHINGKMLIRSLAVKSLSYKKKSPHFHKNPYYMTSQFTYGVSAQSNSGKWKEILGNTDDYTMLE
jgi:hypothetical protein